MAEKEEKVKKEKVAFSPEQMEIIQKMLHDVKENSVTSSPNSVSVYNVRDPKKIETVNVSMIDGKFVLGFKDHQKNPFNKKPKYWVTKKYEERGLVQEPFITLILSNGKEKEEKEIPLIEFYDHKEKFQAKVVKIDLKEIIDDMGVLGNSSEFAVSINDKGIPETRQTIRAEVKREERVFWVELPGFDEPVSFISDFLG